MKRTVLMSLVITAVVSTVASSPVEAQTNRVISPNSDKPYLGVDGIFTLDTTVPSSKRDPRNPGRLVFKKMQEFSFYRDTRGREVIARGCQYIYRGARPDPFYYSTSPTSIWDLFELAPGVPANELCTAFRYVILRSPHGEPIHMHFRYGGDTSSFNRLLRQSNAEEDINKLNPWWSVYCAEGKTACDL